MMNEEYEAAEDTAASEQKPAAETSEAGDAGKKNLREHVAGWYSSNSGMFWGMLIGLIIAVLFLTIGFFQTLLIIIFVALGGFFGSRPDARASVSKYFKDLFTKKPEDNQDNS